MRLIHGDCLEQLKQLPDASVDSLVTDPPAGISFMGKAWDDDLGGRLHWIAWLTLVMAECKRVLKPGAHGLVWALPRTSHWTATALEEAGFEIRDVVTHLFGSGFPKSLDVSKAIDKAAGVEREILGYGCASEGGKVQRKPRATMPGGSGMREGVPTITAPATDAAKKWQGFGTALKPASEHWILVRKPLSEKTVAANVLKWGTGALNIDASRVEGRVPSTIQGQSSRQGECYSQDQRNQKVFIPSPQGRFPANLVFSHTPYCTDEICDIECAIKMLDEQSGTLKSGAHSSEWVMKASENRAMSGANQERRMKDKPADSGGASRFFYCAKISSSERNAGLGDSPDRTLASYQAGVW